MAKKKKPNQMKTLAECIKAAMNDSLQNEGRLTPTNPAIVRDGDGFYYGSSIHQHDGMVWDLQEGLGSFEPKAGDDIDALSLSAAEMIAESMNE